MKPGVPESEETKKNIIEFAKQRLAAYKVPKEIEFRKELPTTLVGKVLKRPLKEEEKKKTGKT